MKARKVNLYLNPENKSHEKVMQYLKSAGAPTTEAVVVAVLAYLRDGQNRIELLAAVERTIKECLSQQVIISPAPNEAETSQVDDSAQAVNDFLAFFK